MSVDYVDTRKLADLMSVLEALKSVQGIIGHNARPVKFAGLTEEHLALAYLRLAERASDLAFDVLKSPR